MSSSLLQLIGFEEYEFKLLYQGTRDGFDSSNFHSKCDNIPNTLTIIKSTNGNIFGGYTDQAWDSSGQYKTDPNAFLFSLINKYNKPTIMKIKDPQYSICCYNGYGPIFGDGFDLMISSNANRKFLLEIQIVILISDVVIQVNFLMDLMKFNHF